MTKIKNIMTILISLLVLLALILNFDKISEKLEEVFRGTPEVVILPGNEYDKKDNYKFVKQVSEYIPYNYSDLINIFYSSLNQGWEEFTFYCPIEYDNCLKDVAEISLDEELLSDINNYVHPFNSYSSIKTSYDTAGKVTIHIKHLYTKDEITNINKYVDEVLKRVTSEKMSDESKVKAIHDYIINNTKYDSDRADKGDSKYDSTRMTGLINEHYAICSAYADMMAVFLNRLGIPNYKISSENHIWNAIYINKKWLHLDLTWDDPISNHGRNILQHDYFLIDNKKLEDLSKDSKDHIFNKDRYLEFKY